MLHWNKLYCTDTVWPEKALGEGAYPAFSTWECLRLILLTLLGYVLPWLKVKPSDLNEIRNGLIEYARKKKPQEAELYESWINANWHRITYRYARNAGWVRLMKEQGVNSLGLFAFCSLVPTAAALESAYGEQIDNSNRFINLLEDWHSARYATETPTFVQIRERNGLSSGLIWASLCRYQLTDQKPVVFSLGCGLMAEFRYFKIHRVEHIRQMRLIVCDADKENRAKLEDALQRTYGESIESLGIEYHECSIEELCMQPDLQGIADVVLLDGIASYYDGIEHKQDLLTKASRLLSQHGVMAFDLQVMDISLIREKVVFAWESTMRPELTAKAARTKMRRIANNLGMHVHMVTDRRNKHPLGVWATLSYEDPDKIFGKGWLERLCS